MHVGVLLTHAGHRLGQGETLALDVTHHVRHHVGTRGAGLDVPRRVDDGQGQVMQRGLPERELEDGLRPARRRTTRTPLRTVPTCSGRTTTTGQWA